MMITKITTIFHMNGRIIVKRDLADYKRDVHNATGQNIRTIKSSQVKV